MGFASLGSGSRGNGTLVALGDALFLVDCGFNLKQAEQRLARRQVSAGDITAILVSHEHSDHIAGVAALAHRYGIPVYASHGTLGRAPEDSVANPLMVMRHLKSRACRLTQYAYPTMRVNPLNLL